MGGAVAHLADVVQGSQQLVIVDIFHKLAAGHLVVERSMLGDVERFEEIDDVNDGFQRTAAVERTLPGVALLGDFGRVAISVQRGEAAFAIEKIKVQHNA